MHLLDPTGKDSQFLSQIFEKIFNKNAIAFLGAGASVTNKKYLSQELIDLYQARISKDFGTTDIIKFVDILQATPGQRRGDFDAFVIDQLRKLEPNLGHEIFVTIPWKQVITTNYDTLVEEASDTVLGKSKTHFNLHVVRNKRQLEYHKNENEITYIKLNGCKTDLSEYPLVFSSEDFEKQKPYYNKVLTPFKTYSNEIIYIAFGYSFSDPFSEILLEKIASSDVRAKRTLYCVDPYVNDDRLGYLESKQISLVKMSFDEFLAAYERWFEENNRNYLKTLQKFTNPDNTNIKLEIHSRLYLDNNIIQLKDDYKTAHKLKKADFYFGEEPTFQVVVDNFDVIKRHQLEIITKILKDSIAEKSKTTIPKLILLNGDFGCGKTTFTLRAIREFLKNSENTLAFEITRPLNIMRGYLSRIVEESSATQFIFYCDNIETDSIFKAFNEIRIDLASEQYSNLTIVFISSIRQNILEKFKNNNKLEIKNCLEVPFDPLYSRSELIQLVENLKEVGILSFRDIPERNAIIKEILGKYKGDSFITLYKLIENGTHHKLLEKAYDELSVDVKNAFKITALVHRFGMACPVSIVKNSLRDYEWKEFTDKIIRGDGKRILFQETRSTMRDEPDLYFLTKHPVIADALVKTVMKNSEKNALYKSIFSSLSFSDFNAWFIVDLIKNIRNMDEDISVGQIENFYELAKREFEKSAHFMLSYITNIEKKTTSIETLERCIGEIKTLEASLDRRNHRLIHRKGSICFKIARLIYRESKKSKRLISYLKEAEEWFDIKKRLDPGSAYSYVDYLNLLLWKLERLDLDDEERMNLHLNINNLFDEAYRTMYSGLRTIDDLYGEYASLNDFNKPDNEYLEFLLERYQNVDSRPSACILLFYYYEKLKDFKKCDQFLTELASYTDDRDVVYFLFKQYGRSLHIPNNRIKLFDIVRSNAFLLEEYPFRFYYFMSIGEFYNWKWKSGLDYLHEINHDRAYNVNPDFYLYWRNSDGDEEIFEGVIATEKRIKKVKVVSPFFRKFPFNKGNFEKFKEGQSVKVKLKFYLNGIRAEIV